MDVKHDTGSDYCSGSERLYLFRENKKEVYVDCPSLQQHQIDALRFLYKTFYKVRSKSLWLRNLICITS